MRRRIFRSVIIVAMTVLLTSLLFISGFIYNFYNQSQVNRLKDELLLARMGVEQLGVSYFEEYHSDLFRFTLISRDGSVVYDSKTENTEMENHLEREEIKEAYATGSGSCRRYSQTLTEQTFYEAVKLKDGSFLRVSTTQVTMATLIVGMLPVLTVIILAAFIFAMFLSQSIAKSVVSPFERLDLDNPENNDTYEELSPVLSKLASDRAFAERNRREFTANVTHELKTPLQSIIGSAELLENRLVKPEDTEKFVGNIRKEATRLVALINDIIRLSQLDENQKPAMENVNLCEVVNEVMEVLATLAAKKNVTLDFEDRNCNICGVRSYIYEIIYNLCDNAIRYNVDGGRVTIEIGQESNWVNLMVKDTGIGIAPEHQNRIFERFYRVDKSHSKETGGTGLGLSIVKHAASCLNAEVEMKSVLNRGTTVTVRFNAYKENGTVGAVTE